MVDAETYNQIDWTLTLRNELLLVEEDRAAGRQGCTIDELDEYLGELIAELP